jgi:hypothetical protein
MVERFLLLVGREKSASPFESNAGERQQEPGNYNSGANKEIQGDGLGEMVGDHVELTLDFGDQGSLSGKGAEGENGGDESVLDEIRSAFIVDEIPEKLLCTVHLRFPPVCLPHAMQAGDALR